MFIPVFAKLRGRIGGAFRFVGSQRPRGSLSILVRAGHKIVGVYESSKPVCEFRSWGRLIVRKTSDASVELVQLLLFGRLQASVGRASEDQISLLLEVVPQPFLQLNHEGHILPIL